MIEKFFNWLRWLYWKFNRRFLESFAVALIGRGREDLLPDGKQIMDRLEEFLREIPSNAFRQFTLLLMVLPLSVPKKTAKTGIGRFLSKVWIVIKGNFTRYGFPSLSREEQARYIDELFRGYAKQAAEEEDDLLKSIIILTSIKSLLSASYLELESTWKGLDYSPIPRPPRSFAPPSGDPVTLHPKPTQNSIFLHENAKRPNEVRRKVEGVTNYCVIGSGAGGAVTAQRIKELDPTARVIILESGPLTTNEQFPVHIMDAIAKLYMNTGATLSKNQMFAFRQGRTVGGSTALNNGVAIKPEGFWWKTNLVERWKELGADLNWEEFHSNFDEVGKIINVHPIEERIITPMARTLMEGFKKAAPELDISAVPVNTTDCVGCGRCNAGCMYDSKQSMLTTFIPLTVRAGGLLVPNAHAEELKIEQPSNGNQRRRVKSVLVTTPEGESIEIEADKFVVAAGAYASTKLLWKSGFTGVTPGVRTVGKRFTGNLGSPVFGRFSSPQLGWTGQQIGYLIEVPDERLVIETAFGPPIALGLSASQWGDAFMRVVESYNNFGVAVPVFGALSYGQIDRGLLPTVGWVLDYRLGGFVIDFNLIEEDWRRLAKGMKLSAMAMFAMGAEEVFTTRFDAKGLRPGDNIDDYFDGIGPIDFLHVETAHLQGGNVIHKDPEQGVVDESGKVHGFDNLWISDASVFPAPITVNIQFTVMALARYIARRVVAG